MSTENSSTVKQTNPLSTHTNKNLTELRARLARLKKFAPLRSLASTRSSQFGRQIENAITHLNSGQERALRLTLRKHDAAVVMSVDEYDHVLELQRIVEELVAAQANLTITQATDSYDALYQRLTSPASRDAADKLFTASAEELAENYRPGTTESQ